MQTEKSMWVQKAEKTVWRWFACCKAGDFNLEDQECSGRPSNTDEYQIKTLIENNPNSEQQLSQLDVLMTIIKEKRPKLIPKLQL